LNPSFGQLDKLLLGKFIMFRVLIIKTKSSMNKSDKHMGAQNCPFHLDN
jgi:hypothetical protein